MRKFFLIMLILLVCVSLCVFWKCDERFSSKLVKERTHALFKIYKQEILHWIKPTVIMFMIYFVGILAIVHANFYYIDDLGRNFSGYRGWFSVYSRYVSDLLSPFIHGDIHLTDISPLTQIIAVLLISMASIVVLHLITEKKKFSFFEYVSVIPLGLSPYFLECLSYKYDSPYMALSVLSAVCPLLFYKKGKSIYALACILGTIIMCTTYQASSGIFPMLVIVLALVKWNRKEEIKSIFKFLISSMLWYVAALLIFKLYLMVPVDDSYSNTTMPPLLRLIPTVLDNFKTYFYLIITDFKIEWTIAVVLICLSMVYIMVRDSKQKKGIALFVTIVSLVIMIFMSFGIYLLLEQLAFPPRSMYCFGAFIAFVACVVATAPKAVPSKLICLCLSWVFFAFAFTYGNALFVQKTYTDFRIQRAIDDIVDLEIIKSKEDASDITMQIEGSIGYAQSIRNMPQDYQMLNRLVPITFCEEWSWGRYGFSYYYGLHNIKWDDSIDLTTYDLPVLEDNIYHTIKGNEKYILLELKE